MCLATLIHLKHLSFRTFKHHIPRPPLLARKLSYDKCHMQHAFLVKHARVFFKPLHDELWRDAVREQEHHDCKPLGVLEVARSPREDQLADGARPLVARA